VQEIVSSKYPHHLFIGEESVSSGLSKYILTKQPTWIVDPIDGTTNFVHGIPFTCISIGIAINRKVVVGVVYNPILNELFEAAKGEGAKLNGKPIKTSAHNQLHHLLIATGFPTDRNNNSKFDYLLANIREILPRIRDLRRFGSAALDICSVACGRLDGYFEFHIHSWDIAAGTLILEEAGGLSLDPSGADLDLMSGKIVAANSPSVAHQLVGIMVPIPEGLF